MSRPPRRNEGHNEVRNGSRPAHPGRRHGRPKPAPEGGSEWIWGRHAVEAALANPRREGLKRLVLAPGRQPPKVPAGVRAEILELNDIARLLPQGAVHQGFALLADPLEPASLEEIATPASGVILMLDQVTDPQNIGTILRSAAAFGARGVVLQERHAPRFSGALTKAAAGALDIVPIAREVNLSRALEQLSDLGWRSIGLKGEAEVSLHQALDGSPTVLVLGSEGEGLRRLVAEHCDLVARIPMPGGFESLNVAAAAAVALYEAARPVAELARPGKSIP